MIGRFIAFFIAYLLWCGVADAQKTFLIAPMTVDQLTYGPDLRSAYSSDEMRKLRFRVAANVPRSTFNKIRNVLRSMYHNVGLRLRDHQIYHAGIVTWDARNRGDDIVFMLNSVPGYAACGWWSSGARVVQIGPEMRDSDNVVIAHELGHCLFGLEHINHPAYLMCSWKDCYKSDLWSKRRNASRPWTKKEAEIMREIVRQKDARSN